MSTAPLEVTERFSETIEELARPWVVIVWNDPVNLMQYVVWVLQKLFGYSRESS